MATMEQIKRAQNNLREDFRNNKILINGMGIGTTPESKESIIVVELTAEPPNLEVLPKEIAGMKIVYLLF